MSARRIDTQDTNASSGTASVTANLAATPLKGNLLTAVVLSNQPLGTNAISGWNMVKDQDFSAGNFSLTWFDKISAGTESSVTATATGATMMRLTVMETEAAIFTSVADALEQIGSGSATSQTHIDSGTFTTLNPRIIAFMAAATSADSGGFVSFSNSYDSVNTNNRLMVASRTAQASSVNVQCDATWTTARNCGYILVTYKSRPIDVMEMNLLGVA